jgi:hypothetical protein
MWNGLAARSPLLAALIAAACSPPSAARIARDLPMDAASESSPADAPSAAEDAPSAADDAAVPDDATQPEAAGLTPGWPGPPLVVAVGNDGRHALSLDGTRWTADTRDAMGNRDSGPRTLRAVAYGDHTVVAVGGGCNPDCVSRVVTFDGVTWTESAVPPGQGRLDGVAHGNGIWVAVGTAGPVLRSLDGGRTWVPTASAGAPGGLRAVAFGRLADADAEIFVAAGDGYTRLRSVDGATWTDLQPPTASGTGAGYRALAIGGGVAVAVGAGGRRIRSADGITWTGEVSGGPDLLSVVFTGDRFMAFSGSGDNTAQVSADGTVWTTRATTNAGANVAYGALGDGALFVSRVSPSTIRTSADGLAWTVRLPSMPGDATINAFAFAGE